MNWTQALPDEIDQGLDHFGGLRAASDAVLCELIQAADLSQHWMADGSRTFVEWVAMRLRVRVETARHLVGLSRRLLDLPVVSARFADGGLSLDQVDAISKMATPDTEETLVEEAMRLSNFELDRRARRAHPPTVKDERDVWRRRALFMQWNLDQSELKFRGQMPAVHGEILQEALESRAGQFGPNPESGLFDPYAVRLADALVEMAATSGDTSSQPPQITLHADLEALTTPEGGVTELGHGALVPNETARRLGCDAVVETVVERDNVVVGIGRNSRVIPGWLRRQVYHRDGSRCRFPGCGNTRWLEVHHRQHWAEGGPTDLDNLVLVCGFHHRFVHEHGWRITGPPDRPVFRRPDWRPVPEPPPPLEPRLMALVRQR